MRRIFLILTLLACAAPLAAQAPASSRAQDIVDAFSARRTMPALKARALLDAAPADVCEALGKILIKMPSANARQLIDNIARCNNPRAMAALLLPLEDPKSEIGDACMNALLSQDYPTLINVRTATPALDDDLIARLQSKNRWEAILKQAIWDVCLPIADVANPKSESLVRKQVGIALLAQAFAGEDAFQMTMQLILDVLVGQSDDWELLKEARAHDQKMREKAQEAAEEEREFDPSEFETEEIKAKAEKWTRAEINYARRRAAEQMFTNVFLYSPEYFQLANGTFKERRKRADDFWVDASIKIWGKRADEVESWSDHLLWASRYAESEFRSPALLIMDRVCGGVKIPTPVQEIESMKARRIRNLKESFPEGEIPKAALKFDDLPKEVAVFVGDTDIKKIANFNQLHSTYSRKPRIRGLRSAFEKAAARIKN